MIHHLPDLLMIANNYGYLAVFIGASFVGEAIIIAAIFLSMFGFFRFYDLVIVTLCGVFFADTIWYTVGFSSRRLITGRRHKIFSAKFNRRIDFLKERFHDDYAKLLIGCKFAYGLGIPVLFTAGYVRLPYRRFLKYNFLANFLWLAVILVIAQIIQTTLRTWNGRGEYWLIWLVFGLGTLWLMHWLVSKIIRFKYEQ
ncbi:MAG: VTT domain-containing protein [Patescibacteria group bacterium]